MATGIYVASYGNETYVWDTTNADASVVDSRAEPFGRNIERLKPNNFVDGEYRFEIVPHQYVNRLLIELGKIRDNPRNNEFFTQNSVAINGLVKKISDQEIRNGDYKSPHYVGCAVDIRAGSESNFHTISGRLLTFIRTAANNAGLDCWLTLHPNWVHVVVYDKNGYLFREVASNVIEYVRTVDRTDPEHEGDRESEYYPQSPDTSSNSQNIDRYIFTQSVAKNKPGATRIGDVWLTVPPERIDLMEDNQQYELETIRSIGNPKIHTNRMTSAIRMDLKFVGTDVINTEFRPIMAMFNRTPFVTIRNSLLQRTIIPAMRYGKDRILIKDNNNNEIPEYQSKVREIMTAFYGDFGDREDIKRFAILNVLSNDRYSDIMILPDAISAAISNAPLGDEDLQRAMISSIRNASNSQEVNAIASQMMSDSGEVQYITPASRIQIDVGHIRSASLPNLSKFNIDSIAVFREGMISDNVDIPVVLESIAASRIPSMIDGITVTITARIFNHIPYGPQLRFLKDFTDVIKQANWIRDANTGDARVPSDINYTTDISESIPFMAYYAGELEKGIGDPPLPHRTFEPFTNRFNNTYTGNIKKLPTRDTGELDSNNIAFMYRYNKDDLSNQLLKNLQEVLLENEKVNELVSMYNRNRHTIQGDYQESLTERATPDGGWWLRYPVATAWTVITSWQVTSNPFNLNIIQAAYHPMQKAIADLKAELSSIFSENPEDIDRVNRLKAILTRDMSELYTNPLDFSKEELGEIEEILSQFATQSKFTAIMEKLIAVRDELGKFNPDNLSSMDMVGVGSRVIALNDQGWSYKFGDDNDRRLLDRQGNISLISDTHITGMSLSNNNKITPISIEGYEIPSFQHFGRGDWKLHITFNTGDLEFLAEMRILTARAHATEVSKMNSTDTIRKHLVDSAIIVANPWLNMFGIDKAIINSVNYSTIPGQLGRYEVTLQMTQADFNLTESEVFSKTRELGREAPTTQLIKLIETVLYDKYNCVMIGDPLRSNDIFGYALNSNKFSHDFVRPKNIPSDYDLFMDYSFFGGNVGDYTVANVAILKDSNGRHKVKTTRPQLGEIRDSRLRNSRGGASSLEPFRVAGSDQFPFQNSRLVSLYYAEYAHIPGVINLATTKTNNSVGDFELLGLTNLDFILRNADKLTHGDKFRELISIPGMSNFLYKLETAIMASDVVFNLNHNTALQSGELNLPSIWEAIRSPIDTASSIITELSQILNSLELTSAAAELIMRLADDNHYLSTFNKVMTSMITEFGLPQSVTDTFQEFIANFTIFKSDVHGLGGRDLEIMYPDLMLPKWDNTTLSPDFYFYITGNDIMAALSETSELIQRSHNIKIETMARSSLLSINDTLSSIGENRDDMEAAKESLSNAVASSEAFLTRELGNNEEEARAKLNMILNADMFDPEKNQTKDIGLTHYQLKRIEDITEQIASIYIYKRRIKDAEETIRRLSQKYKTIFGSRIGDFNDIVERARRISEIKPQSFTSDLGLDSGEITFADANALKTALTEISAAQLRLASTHTSLGYLQSPLNSEHMYRSYGIATVQGNQISDSIRKLGHDNLKNQGVNRMIRAFPTAKVYFIEEDNPRWVSFDDYFDYNAIYSVDVVRDDESATDICVITISNLTGAITDDLQNRSTESFQINRNEGTEGRYIDEYNVAKIPISVGTKIMVRLGYGDSFGSIPLVFVGAISNITPGEIMEITAQSYGYELTSPVTTMQKPIKFGLGSTVNSFADLIYWLFETVPGMEHFGNNRPFSSEKSPVRIGYEFLLKSINSTMLAGGQFNPRDENIMLPRTQMKLSRAILRDVQKWAHKFLMVFDEYDGVFTNKAFNWTIFDETPWEIIRDIVKFQKDFIVTILPYNENRTPGTMTNPERATIYVGPKHGYYKYTDIYDDDDTATMMGIINGKEADIVKPGILAGLIMNEINKGNSFIKEPLSDDDVVEVRDRLVSHILDKYSPATGNPNLVAYGGRVIGTSEVRTIIIGNLFIKANGVGGWSMDVMSMEQNSDNNETLFNELFPGNQLRLFGPTIENWGNNTLKPMMIDVAKKIQILIDTYGFTPNDADIYNILPRNERQIIADSKSLIAISDNIDNEETREYIRRIISADCINSRPRVVNRLKGYKPVINYYSVTSATDIINNGISASSEAISNRVIMDFSSEPSDDIYKMPSADNIFSYETNVSDSIDPYEIRTKRVYHNNIDPNLQSFLGWQWGSEAASNVMDTLKAYNDEHGKMLRGEIDLTEPPPIKQDSGLEPSYYTVANNILRDSMKSMYSGTLTIIGNANIKPHDMIYVHDYKNNMHGPITVKRVVHRFSRESGFITEITPGLVTYNRGFFNATTLGELQFAVAAARWKGGLSSVWSTGWDSLFYYGAGFAIKKGVAWGAKSAATATAASVVGGIAGASAVAVGSAALFIVAPAIIGFLKEQNKNMWMQMNNVTGRNSMFMVPLWYKNEPYVAGVRGYRLTDYRVHTFDGLFKVTDRMGWLYGNGYDPMANMIDPLMLEQGQM